MDVTREVCRCNYCGGEVHWQKIADHESRCSGSWTARRRTTGVVEKVLDAWELEQEEGFLKKSLDRVTVWE